MTSESGKSIKALQGLRVVRGPDWRWGNQDGGEGFVGTIVQTLETDDESLLSDPRLKLLKKLAGDYFEKASLGWVSVLWDRGRVCIYRIGHDGAFDLRVVDNAAHGVKHSIGCGACCSGDIKGFRWLCETCGISLCSSCHFNEKHEPDHTRFQRFDTPDSDPVSVVCDKTAAKVQLKGIFPGARVKKGRDWANGNEDLEGSYSGIGSVTTPTYELEPGTVQVKWPANMNTFPYRLGKDGRVDLLLAKHGFGGYYVPANLPTLKSQHLEAVTKDDGEIKFAVGDKVMVVVDVGEFKSMQDAQHGGWNSDMEMVVGREGIVLNMKEVGILVNFGVFKPFWINPAALMRLGPFSIGQPVRVKTDTHSINSMESKFGIQIARKIAGEPGHVRQCIDASERVEVEIDDIEKGKKVYELHASWLEIFPVKEEVNNKLIKLKTKMMTLLVEAAEKGQLTILLQLFSKYKLDVNDKAEKGRTALQLASKAGKLDTVQWLVNERKADIHLTDDKGRTALHHAAKRCHPSVVAFLIEQSKASGVVSVIEYLDMKDKKSFTPLQLATIAGCKESMRILVGNGCDVNIQDSHGDPALYNAIWAEKQKGQYRDYEILDMLVPVSDLKIKNKRNLNSSLIAAATQNGRALEVLFKHQGSTLIHEVEPETESTALHVSSDSGDMMGVKAFLNCAKSMGLAESFLEKRTVSGFTPLLKAAYKGHYAIVEYLIKNNADITAKDKDGDNAFALVAIRLEKITDIPTRRNDSEIFKIYEDLLANCPKIINKYPAVALLCYLVSKGCPWRRPRNSQANKIANNNELHSVFQFYCPGGIQEEEMANTLDFCILCNSTAIFAGVIDDCGHSCDQICLNCVSLVRRCPKCSSPNKSYGRKEKSESDMFSEKFSELTYSKDIGEPTTNPAAMSAQSTDGQQTRDQQHDEPTVERGKQEAHASSNPTASQQPHGFGYEQQQYSTAYPQYSYPNEDCPMP